MSAEALRASHPRVACVGTYIVDVLGRPVAELPRGQTSRLLDEIRITPAGTAGGTSVDLARLGAHVLAVGAIGQDLAGDFMPNADEAMAAANAPDIVTAARRFREHGARCVVVKRGPDGCLLADDEGERTLPAYAIDVVDTTGCGDAFCAGVIVARCAGRPIDEAARLGCATGSLNVRALGSDAGATSVDEALAFMDAVPEAFLD